MGMFDYIEDERVRCPRCGSALHVEMQTKSIEPGWGGTMTRYLPHYQPRRGVACHGCKPPFSFLMGKDEGHKLPGGHAHVIAAYATCNSPTCRARDRAIDVLERGWTSGGGFHFDVEYRTNDEFMIGRPKVLRRTAEEEGRFADVPMAKLATLLARRARRDPKNRARWSRSMKLAGGQALLAVLDFEPPFPVRRRSRKGKR